MSAGEGNPHQTFEQKPGDLITEYAEQMRDLADRYNGGMQQAAREHQEGMQRLIDDISSQPNVPETMNATSSMVSIGVTAARQEVEEKLETFRGQILGALPDSARTYWDRIQEQVAEADEGQTKAELSTKILNIRGQLDHVPDEEARELMKAAFDSDLWQMLQEVVHEQGMGTYVKALLSAVSGPEARAAMGAGLDQFVWTRVHGGDIRRGLKSPAGLASIDDASSPEVQAAMRAARDYQVLKAAKDMQYRFDSGGKDYKDMEEVLGFATEEGREAIERELRLRPPKQEEEEEFFGDFRDRIFNDPFARASGYGRRHRQERQGPGPSDDRREDAPPHESPEAPDLESTDPYAILGVSPDAEGHEIKSAYRRLAREHHTDVGGDEESIKLINDAYDKIGTPDRRAYFDLHGTMRGFKKP